MNTDVVYITGQECCKQEDFDRYYLPSIEKALRRGDSFLIENFNQGVGAFARTLLWDVHRYNKVTLYDIFGGDAEIPEGSEWALNAWADWCDARRGATLNSNRVVIYIFGTPRNIKRDDGTIDFHTKVYFLLDTCFRD
jgi:hypothetical protein